MAIDFPDSPSLNEIYSSGGKSWVWNGSVWKQGLGSYSQVGHTHSTEDVTSGIFSIDRIPTITGSVSSNYVVRSDDARLTDSRTPLSHTHSAADITTGTFNIARLPVASSGSSSSSEIVRADDSRLSNSRTPTSHTHSISEVTNLQTSLDAKGTVSSVAVSGGTTGLTTSGGPITGSGTITIAGTLAIASGGTGQTTAQAAINALAGATTSAQFLRGNGTNVVMSAIQSSDVPTLNQNTTGTASNVTGTVAVANGGTGATSLTANNIVMGNGTSTVQLIAPGSTGNLITSNGTTWTSAAPAITLAGNNTWTGLQTFAGSATNLDIKLSSALEAISVIASSASSTINFDVISQSVLYYTGNSSANWTLNIRGNSSTSLTSLMSAGESLTIVFLATNSGTAYRQTSLTIDGNSITPKWLGGSAPSTGNANSIDIYTVTIIKTGVSSFTVLESQSKFA